jgi:hypothetical protein
MFEIKENILVFFNSVRFNYTFSLSWLPTLRRSDGQKNPGVPEAHEIFLEYYAKKKK